MYKMILTLGVFLFGACGMVLADQGDQTITLKDGSQIKGQLAGIDNGIYTVKTPIIGDVHVNASDVASITNGNVQAAAPAPMAAAATPSASGTTPDFNQQIATQQQRLMSNPQSMAVLQQMAQDPEIMQALQDPALVQAVTSHDYEAVKDNPRVQALMSDPKMQALLQQLAQQQQQQTTSSQ